MSLFRTLTRTSLALALSGLVGLGVLGILSTDVALADGLNVASSSVGVVQGADVGPQVAGRMAALGTNIGANSRPGPACGPGCGTTTATKSTGVVQAATSGPRPAVQAAFLGKHASSRSPSGGSGGSSNAATRSAGVVQGVSVAPRAAAHLPPMGKDTSASSTPGGAGCGCSRGRGNVGSPGSAASTGATARSQVVAQGVGVSPQPSGRLAMSGKSTGADTRSGANSAGSSSDAKTLGGVRGKNVTGNGAHASAGTTPGGATKDLGGAHGMRVSPQRVVQLVVLGKNASARARGGPGCGCSTPAYRANAPNIVSSGANGAPQASLQPSILGQSTEGYSKVGSGSTGGSSIGYSGCGSKCGTTRGSGIASARDGAASGTSSGHRKDCSPSCAVGSVTADAAPSTGGVPSPAQGADLRNLVPIAVVFGAGIAPAAIYPTAAAGSPESAPQMPQVGARALGASLSGLAPRLGAPVAATLAALSVGLGQRGAPPAAAPGRLPAMGGGYAGRQVLDDLAEYLVLLAAATGPRLRALVR